MTHSTWRERARYRFDNFMARGTGSLLLGLGVATAGMILLIAALVALTHIAPQEEGGERPGFLRLAWMGLLRAMDTGTMSGDSGSPWFLLAMLAVTMGGVFTVSTLIGILNNGLDDKLKALRKGRSRVIEEGHIVLLGWSQQVLTVLSELLLAHQDGPGVCLVLMGDKDKVEMEEEIAARLDAAKLGRSRIVCRSGSPIDLGDLEIVSLDTARAILLLSPDGDDPDSSVIKTLVAILNRPRRRTEPFHVVAEIRDPRNVGVAKMVGRDEVEVVAVGDLISRIIAQTCRQSGLSVIYTELLDFGGDEIYFRPEPSLAGWSFGDTLAAYDESTVLGIAPAGAAPMLNPPMDTLLRDGDRLIFVAPDEASIRLTGKPSVRREGVIQKGEPEATAPERTLILGWNWRAPTILRELDHYVAKGSQATVVANLAPEGDGAFAGGENLAVHYVRGDTTDRSVLDGIAIETYQHVIVLSYADTLDVQRADAVTLVTLLHLRDIAERQQRTFSIVSEMLDVRNRTLAEVTRADDFIVSDRLVSLLLAQLTQNKQLNAVFTNLFDPEGSEIYLKPAESYVRPGAPVDFYTVLEAARQRGEVALGYRITAQTGDPAKAYGVRLNPRKSETVTFTAGDRIVVLAES